MLNYFRNNEKLRNRFETQIRISVAGSLFSLSLSLYFSSSPAPSSARNHGGIMVDRLLPIRGPALDDDEFARHATAGTRDSSVANIVTTEFDMRTGNQEGRPPLCIEGMRLREAATRLPSLLSRLVKSPELRARPPPHPCHFLPFFLYLFLLNPADLRLRQIPQRKRAFAPFAVMLLYTPKCGNPCTGDRGKNKLHKSARKRSSFTSA